MFRICFRHYEHNQQKLRFSHWHLDTKPNLDRKSICFDLHLRFSLLKSLSVQDVTRELELLIHPRAPPLVRSLPHVETLSLYRAEESQEEQETRQALHIGIPGELATAASDDVTMQSISSFHARTHNGLSTHMPLPSVNSVPTAPIQNPAPPAISLPPTQLDRVAQPVFDRPVAVDAPVAAMTTSATLARPPPDTPSLSQAKSTTLLSSSDPVQRSLDLGSANQISHSTPQVVTVVSHKMVVDSEDEDEPMPTIDMDSDSEAE